MAHIGVTGWCVVFSRRLKWVGWLSVCGCAHSVHVLNPACWLGVWSSSTRLQNHPPRRHTHPRVRGSLCSGYALNLFHCKDDAGGHGMCSWHLTSSFLCVSYLKPENMKLATASSFLSLWKTVLQEAVTHELLSFQDILPIEIFFPIVLLFFFFHSWILSS